MIPILEAKAENNKQLQEILCQWVDDNELYRNMAIDELVELGFDKTEAREYLREKGYIR